MPRKPPDPEVVALRAEVAAQRILIEELLAQVRELLARPAVQYIPLPYQVPGSPWPSWTPGPSPYWIGTEPGA